MVKKKWGRIEDKSQLGFSEFMDISALNEEQGYLISDSIRIGVSFHTIKESYPANVDERYLTWTIEGISKFRKFVKKQLKEAVEKS